MYYEPMPLYPALPSCRGGDTCVKVPMFEGDRCAPRPMLECQRVTIENPCRPGEWAEVILGVDTCGSLMVCVHRAPRRPGHGECRGRERRCLPSPDCRPEPCRPPEPRGCCSRGRLYGTWR